MLRPNTSQKKPADHFRLNKLLGLILQSGLIGKKCWKVTFTSGDLCLHMGRRLPYDNPRMAGEKKGQWIFSTCGTQWVLETPGSPISPAPGQDEHLIEQRAAVILNSRIIDFALAVPRGHVVLFFDNGCALRLTPTGRDARHNIPYWELFLPENKLISFGPGMKWNLRRSNVPHPAE